MSSPPASSDIPPRVLILLCTYRERENLERLIPEILEQVPQADLLVIDDGSPDGTREFLEDYARRDDRVSGLDRGGKLGLGTAILAGMQQAIDRGYDVLLNLDADFSHPPRFLPDLLAGMAEADVVIGSRYVPGGGIVGWTWSRKLMSRCINWYARLLLGLKTRDNSGSFRCYRVAKLAELDFARIRGTGYAFMEEILYRLRRINCRMKEVPIVFEERRFGQSKINGKEAAKALWVIFRLFVDRVFRVGVRKGE